MASFKDCKERRWTVEVTVTGIKNVRNLLGIDLYAIAKDRFAIMGEIVGDPVKLIDVIYALCIEQCKEAEVSDADFGRGMAGDALDDALHAFQDAVADFFPDARQRAGLRKVNEAGRKTKEAILKAGEREMENLNTDAIATKAAAMILSQVKASNASASNAPESPKLTPAQEPSANS